MFRFMPLMAAKLRKMAKVRRRLLPPEGEETAQCFYAANSKPRVCPLPPEGWEAYTGLFYILCVILPCLAEFQRQII